MEHLSLDLATRGYCFYCNCALLSLKVGDLDGAKSYFAKASYWLRKIDGFHSNLLTD
jgi:hypothetical protein